MPKYLIEREIPGAGQLSASDLRAMSQRSCEVIGNLGRDLYWVESFVTEDKVYCIYIAPDAELIESTRSRAVFRPIGSARSRASSTRDPLIKENRERHAKYELE